MKLSRIALFGAALALLLFLAAALGTRFGMWPFTRGFQLLALALCVGALSAILAFGVLFTSRRAGQQRALFAALVISLAALSVPLHSLYRASQAPAIHDISTDLDDPPEFVAVAPLRGEGENPLQHGGTPVANLQRKAYSDVQPHYNTLPPADAFARALATARDMGWEIVASDAERGHIEATDTTFWFGFKDDIVIRITSDGERNRIDVRSMSRVGRSDLGANARRVRAYLQRIAR